jgi:predicted nucleotidyltransferase
MDATASIPLGRLLARARRDPDVLAVMLFGSGARGEAAPGSDLDVCLVLAAARPSALAASHKRLEYLGEGDLDVAIFQQLPLYIRSRVLREGRVLFVRDEEALYALATRTARTFEDFRHVHRQYIDQVARG